jgi:hypothetical protein
MTCFKIFFGIGTKIEVEALVGRIRSIVMTWKLLGAK